VISQGDWNLADCLRILRCRKAALLCIPPVAAIAAALITYAQPRAYQSRATVEVQSLNENFLNFRAIHPNVAPRVEADLYVQTQADLLQQDSLLEEVARRLRLAERRDFQPSSALLPKLRQDIRIVPATKTRLIQIICDAADSYLAADLANTVAETFIEQSSQNWRRGARQTYQSLQLQIKQLTPGGADSQPVYATLLEEANDARTAAMLSQPSIRIVSAAQPAGRPYKPNVPANFVIGLLGGLVAAVGLIMLREQNTHTFRASGETETYLGIPEIGAIPDAGLRSPSVAEAFRNTITALLPADGDSPLVIALTSALPGEGKTTSARNLGVELAGIGRKTLLIDADMRHPQLHEVFGLPNAWGLSDFLVEGSALEELPVEAIVKPTSVPHLFLLPAGVHTRHVFSSSALDRLFERVREEFDCVLVDAPPCAGFADARTIARHADGVVLIVRADLTGRGTVQAAAKLLQAEGAKITGVILNRYDLSHCA
jgi:receptor protein-tyrosine kinase